MHRNTVLTVDDDSPLCGFLRQSLEREGYQVLVANTTEEAQATVKETPVDLLLLDVKVPNVGGIGLCRWIRSESNNPRLPVLMMSVLGSENDKVNGLEAGADDYLCKPFSPAVLAARVRALLRRTGHMEPSVELGDISINYGTCQVKVKNAIIHLSPREYDILNVFVKNPGKLLTRKALCEMVWGDEGIIQSYDRIDKYILILRHKLNECGNYIKTAWGLGYRFIPPK
jgi:two-component system phosphate regulon response regulator PhoB